VWDRNHAGKTAERVVDQKGTRTFEADGEPWTSGPLPCHEVTYIRNMTTAKTAPIAAFGKL
jgi:hypothetical protein